MSGSLLLPILAGGGAIGNLLGGILGGNSAANAEKQAANQILGYANGIYSQTQQNEQPYLQAGQAGANLLTQDLPQLSQGFDPTLSQLQQTPGYQFALQQGLESTQNGFSAQGLGVSGAAIKGAQNYAEGLADQTYQQQANIYNQNRTTTADILQGTAGLGQSAASTIGQVGSNTLGAVSNALTGIGNANAAASTVPYTAASNGLNQLLQYYLLSQSPLMSGSGGNA